MKMKNIRIWMYHILDYLLIVPLILYTYIVPKKHDTLIFGSTPILSNKYWSEALRACGYKSLTYMTGCYETINNPSDFDKYFQGHSFIKPIKAFIYVVRNAKVIHMPYSGFAFGDTPLWMLEGWLYKIAGVKTVIIPYGADAYCYSRMIDKNLAHALLMSYPDAAKRETEIQKRINFWDKHADCIIRWMMLDGAGRWDVNVTVPFVVDTEKIRAKRTYSNADGHNDYVNIIHTPNHRGFKGTEFLINVVEELNNEGLKINLILCEKMKNDEVLKKIENADILAEQFIFTGYALSGIEGMASGLPVMSNLEDADYTLLFRRYSYLQECPILSTSPETLKENLRTLVENPLLRQELGMKGRKYVEKYHSYKTAQYMFEKIYIKLFKGDVSPELINLFHPLLGSYIKS